MINRKKLLQQNRAVFTMTVKHNITEYNEINRNGRQQDKIYDNLAPSEEFHVRFRKHRKRMDNNGVAYYSDVRDFCERIINEEIADELRMLFDIPIKKIKVNRTYEGSLIIVFSVLFNLFQFISSIAGFRDTIKLIQNTVYRHMKKRLNDEFITEGYFEINVRSERDDDYYTYLVESNNGGLPVSFSNSRVQAKRDGFFWYLLITNIVLLIIIGIFVGKAVIKMYW